jgi:hypothetical protein
MLLVTTAIQVYLVVNIHGKSLSFIFRNFDNEPNFSVPKSCSIMPVKVRASILQACDNAVDGYGLSM